MKSILAITVVLILSGCSAAAPVMLWDTGSLVVTDKTVVDNIYSLYSGKNCSAVRYKQGRTYCEEDEPNPVSRYYCYRTLGEITCYEEPDPHYSPQAQVGRDDRNLNNYQ